MSWIEIKTRYQSRCDVCGKVIHADTQAMMEVEDRVYAHADCHENELRKMNNANSPIQPVQDGVTVRYNPPKKD